MDFLLFVNECIYAIVIRLQCQLLRLRTRTLYDFAFLDVIFARSGGWFYFSLFPRWLDGFVNIFYYNFLYILGL